ncbi:MAG TPA: hypothetical protein VGC37_10010 [Friedmanniella sp.]
MTSGPDPSASTVLRAAGVVVRLDDRGTVVGVASAETTGATWLAESGTLTVATGDGPVLLGPPRVVVDVDEVEVERSGGGLRTVVRHAVEHAWTVRVVLANESDVALALTSVRLAWRAAPGTVVTALAAGAQASYAVQPTHGDGPVLVGRLRSGAQPGVDEHGLLLGPLVLAPHHRWAVQWRWEVEPDPRRVAAADLPRTTWLDRGQTLVLPGSPDVAVVAPGLAVEVEDDRVEVDRAEPGSSVLELRSARGTTAYPLTWAPDLDDLVDAATEALLAGPTSPAGTVRLGDAAAGLVVQDALLRRTGGTPDALADALELVAGDLLERLDDLDVPGSGVADPLTLAFLARETDRATGTAVLDVAVLDVAVRRLLLTVAPAPGLGLAGVGLALALVRTGRPATEVVAHLTALRSVASPAAGPGDDAALELALLLRPRDAVADEPWIAGLRRLGASLGAGLPGRVVPVARTEAVAYASTLLSLVDEPTGQRLRQTWGVTASELARRTAAEARARTADLWRATDGGDPAGRRALAWLVLGRR